MSKIRILPEILSNKIAAGEVVERPAAVVKELVENALDAGSSRIVVEVEKGGRSLIRVADNGTGMGHDDALLALERYATSKIHDDNDLYAIRTLGFRGEALPSIAAVSRFALVTREDGAQSGVEIRVDGGHIRQVNEVGAPVGTMITVRQLFYNTPARRKYLKTVATEMGHLSDVLVSRALAHPEVYFRLSHNGRDIKTWPAVSDPVERVADVFGKEARRYLLPVNTRQEGVSIEGWVGAPPFVRATGQGIYTFVNRRCIRSRVVQHGLMQGYAGRLMKGQFPVAVLFVGVAFEEVDVNVHPAKHEVRFARQKQVHEAVRQATAEALGRLRPPAGSGRPGSRPKHEVREPFDRYQSVTEGRGADPEAKREPAAGGIGPLPAARGPGEAPGRPDSSLALTPDLLKPRPGPALKPRQAGLWQGGRFSELILVGQAHNSYILCQSEDGLVVVDQHAAHERVIYESLARRSVGARPAAQRLLIPEPIELGYRQAAVLKTLIPEFAGLGLAIEPFGPNAFAVTSVPVILAGRPASPLVVEIVEKTVDIGVAVGMQTILDQAVKLMACHGAIRARQALSTAQMRTLLSQLDGCENPYHCPHGRPTWIRWSRRELEKLFGRVG